jgi:ribonuclease R
MVLANQAIASHLRSLSLPAIYCVQSAPDSVEIQDLIKLAGNLGLPFQLKQEDEVSSQDYQRFTQMFSKSNASGVLNHLLKSTLKPSGYSTTAGSHFGLALDSGYTHCLSPLRRYADLLVQRVLHLLFDKGRDRRTTRAKESVNLHHSSSHGNVTWNVLPPDIHEELENHLSSIISHLNDREKLAQDAEADLEGLKKAEMMKERTGEVFQGMITGVQSYGFFVEIEDLLVEGLVHVSSLKDDWYEYRSRHCCLVGRKNRMAFRLGDRVEVQVKSVDYYRQQIDLVTVGGGSEASNEDIDGDE